jgi:hypothetical protein
MKQTSAKNILSIARSNVGHLLVEFRQIKANPDNYSNTRRHECSKLLSANQCQVADILNRFPELRPERAEQLKLEL